MKNNSAIFFVVVDEFIQWALQKRWRNIKLLYSLNKKEILENVARNRNENIHPLTWQNIKNKCMRLNVCK